MSCFPRIQLGARRAGWTPYSRGLGRRRVLEDRQTALPNPRVLPASRIRRPRPRTRHPRRPIPTPDHPICAGQSGSTNANNTGVELTSSGFLLLDQQTESAPLMRRFRRSEACMVVRMGLKPAADSHRSCRSDVLISVSPMQCLSIRSCPCGPSLAPEGLRDGRSRQQSPRPPSSAKTSRTPRVSSSSVSGLASCSEQSPTAAPKTAADHRCRADVTAQSGERMRGNTAIFSITHAQHEVGKGSLSLKARLTKPPSTPVRLRGLALGRI